MEGRTIKIVRQVRTPREGIISPGKEGIFLREDKTSGGFWLKINGSQGESKFYEDEFVLVPDFRVVLNSFFERR